jgi:hypothetical protein
MNPETIIERLVSIQDLFYRLRQANISSDYVPDEQQEEALAQTIRILKNRVKSYGVTP